MALDIIPLGFNFNGDLKRMTQAEKNRLYLEWRRGMGSMAEDEIEFNPSEILMGNIRESVVIDPAAPAEDIDVRNAIAPQFKWHPELGYIVPGEDVGVIDRLELTEAERRRIMQSGFKHVTAQMAEQIKFMALPPVERHAEERFGDL